MSINCQIGLTGAFNPREGQGNHITFNPSQHPVPSKGSQPSACRLSTILYAKKSASICTICLSLQPSA